MTALAAGATIGIIGGGQLGRMLAAAAARLGYRTLVLEPQPDCPAAQLANRQIVAAYDDPEALAELVRECAVVTYEFENVPVAAATSLASDVPVCPPPAALEVSQDRVIEKRFLNAQGLSTAEFLPVDSDADFAAALRSLRGGVLKTRRMGYDGKGQVKITADTDPTEAWAAIGGKPAILEGFVLFTLEISVIVARGVDGQTLCYPPVEN
ncbi:MAG: ATP-grasp domain-containing protein, partial [Alphaproteobacteria bacterium]|nr:ATP-grasp domain-containing protein [Alphaproteobacteria bacterium]